MKIEYEIKGVTLDENDLVKINEYYTAACSAEYLLENYSQVKTEEQAMRLGFEVRRKMRNHGLTEEEAIDAVLKS